MSDPQSGQAVRAVYDANVLFQATISARGPAARCVDAAEAGRVLLHLSDALVEEYADVCSRPKIVAKFKLTPAQVAGFLARVRGIAVIADPAPHVFDLERDPKDEKLINLAAAAGATRLVSRDRDLLDLSDPAAAGREDAARLRRQHPDVRVVDPVAFLQELDAQQP